MYQIPVIGQKSCLQNCCFLIFIDQSQTRKIGTCQLAISWVTLDTLLTDIRRFSFHAVKSVKSNIK